VTVGQGLYDGNEVTAQAALAAGCRFFAGYPITPATGIFSRMLALLPPAGGTVLQAEDEIAAAGYCLGAAMAGLKAMTATSGPGISLISENISFAIGAEIPLVIVNVQRLGPSTGSPTRGADGDIQFMRWGSSGGLPLVVLAPADVRDCFTLTVAAFNLAETYRCPVFLAANKEIAETRENVDLGRLPRPELAERPRPAADRPFLPFATAPGRDVPGFLPIGGPTLVRQTSSTHGVNGYITADPDEIARMNGRLARKLQAAVDRFSFAEATVAPAADTLIVTYGVTARAAKAALAQLKAEGRPASLLILKTLWPVPSALIRRHARSVGRVVVAEMNQGQYVREIRRVLPGKRVAFCGQMNGQLITPGQIQAAVHD
jgi:2-oxoglutarate ferredoxin oxidoreductase subunit alpha